jgi:hypothetical protein
MNRYVHAGSYRFRVMALFLGFAFTVPGTGVSAEQPACHSDGESHAVGSTWKPDECHTCQCVVTGDSNRPLTFCNEHLCSRPEQQGTPRKGAEPKEDGDKDGSFSDSH